MTTAYFISSLPVSGYWKVCPVRDLRRMAGDNDDSGFARMNVHTMIAARPLVHPPVAFDQPDCIADFQRVVRESNGLAGTLFVGGSVNQRRCSSIRTPHITMALRRGTTASTRPASAGGRIRKSRM